VNPFPEYEDRYWFVSFVWLNKINQINQINQTSDDAHDRSLPPLRRFPVEIPQSQPLLPDRALSWDSAPSSGRVPPVSVVGDGE
jgi:hypothetical protein